jgi:predicted DNA-binding ArsR family transcriptional regulator
MFNGKDKNLKYITDDKGRRKEVIIPIKKFETLLEDLEDLVIVAERRDEELVDHQEVIKRLKKDGLL